MTHTWQELLIAMTDRDPLIRDGWAYQELAKGLEDGRWSEELPQICTQVLTHFQHPEIQARTFAPLILTWLIGAGQRQRSFFDTCAQWYLTEDDTRGFDPERGWLHAIAHGADCLGICVKEGIATAEEVLSVLAQRVISEGSAWADQEEARIAVVVLQSLKVDPQVNLDSLFTPIEQALSKVEEIFATADVTFMPPRWLANVQSLAHILYVCANESVLLDGERFFIAKADELGKRSLGLTRRLLDWLIA